MFEKFSHETLVLVQRCFHPGFPLVYPHELHYFQYMFLLLHRHDHRHANFTFYSLFQRIHPAVDYCFALLHGVWKGGQLVGRKLGKDRSFWGEKWSYWGKAEAFGGRQKLLSEGRSSCGKAEAREGRQKLLREN
jgi:hypothetical protein